MAYKRSRTAYEADSRATQPPFIYCGTPLPPLDDETRDDGSYVPVWKQTVTDERGRKRLHGAFTGGFSAGYFNTVGSKEGWTPATFVSSRSKKNQEQPKPVTQRPEDFMDEEDLAALAESRELKTTDSFASLGKPQSSGSQHDNLFGLVMTAGETMGIKLLQKMGWRHGQGIGPKVRRAARLDEGENIGDDTDQAQHFFAPADTHVISFVRKSDHKGLGYRSTAIQADRHEPPAQAESDLFSQPALQGPDQLRKPKKSATKKSGFGVGILNDNGSDDEDPYDMGPRITYKRTLGAEKKPKKAAGLRASNGMPNPLVTARPVFVPRKGTLRNLSSTQIVRTCHDGRPPLDGFVLSKDALIGSSSPAFPPPKVPVGWKSARLQENQKNQPQTTNVVSHVDAAKSSTLDAKARASILGEQQLAGRSIFDFISKESRDRIANLTGRHDLPQGLGQTLPSSNSQQHKDLWSLVPPLSKEEASAALSKRGNGWMPYAEDLEKRARYIAFLELRAGKTEALPERAENMTIHDWARELQEFVHAAQVFKPVSGIMASRFTSSKDPGAGNTQTGNDLLQKPVPKPEDPAVEAARMGMYGPMTRTIFPFTPTRLLCKRWNVKPPADVSSGTDPPFSQPSSHPSYSRETMSGQAKAGTVSVPDLKGPPAAFNPPSQAQQSAPGFYQSPIVDTETNSALEADRPGQEVFKAIFGSDDEDED